MLIEYQSSVSRLSTAEIVRSTMTFGLEQYFLGDQFRESWDIVQQSKLCCGINNSTDWLLDIPDSCYTNNTLYTRGCLDIVQADVIGDIDTILGSCISFVVLEMIAIAVIVGTS